MTVQVLGISGSPVHNSNTDRLVRAVLDATGLDTDFIKLSDFTIRPCRACLGCAADNICRQGDDFAALAPKIRAARALVVGGYPPYGMLDGFTKAFLERLYSMRHQNMLNKGKLGVAVTTGMGGDAPGLQEANDQIARVMEMEGMKVVGRLQARGNLTCLVCGQGETCPISAVPHFFGDREICEDRLTRVEQQPVWQEALAAGREIGRRLKQG
ncbi:MAG: flavodoxin family protein [Desulfobulbaceae bacterium]|nr:flavodoxin family protein [Desulfobulbaceae bacterium]MDW7774608.1 flavodoxin family protein [Desulfobulbaceae bacterium]